MNMKKDGAIAIAVVVALGGAALGIGLGLEDYSRKAQLDACVYFGLTLWLIAATMLGALYVFDKIAVKGDFVS
jgi:succinate dehydrogenase hydrophobic anchor subunit